MLKFVQNLMKSKTKIEILNKIKQIGQNFQKNFKDIKKFIVKF